jgi:hypothetical protein
MLAEYALRDIDKLVGVSEYKLFEKLPEQYAELLPSAEDIASRIGAIERVDEIENFIATTLSDDVQHNALNFVQFLRSHEMQFERGKGYWEDKFYWLIKFRGEYVCFVLIDGIAECGQPWVIWTDDSGSNWYETLHLDEHTREIAWANIDFCGNCGNCDGGKPKTIFGKTFENVCRTTFRFDNPDSEAVECAKQLVELRKADILKRQEK